MKSKMAVLLIGLVFALVSSLALTQRKPLKDDDLHDPDNPALALLQEPQEALGVLQPGAGGNLVDWVAALQTGQINPRASTAVREIPAQGAYAMDGLCDVPRRYFCLRDRREPDQHGRHSRGKILWCLSWSCVFSVNRVQPMPQR